MSNSEQRKPAITKDEFVAQVDNVTEQFRAFSKTLIDSGVQPAAIVMAASVTCAIMSAIASLKGEEVVPGTPGHLESFDKLISEVVPLIIESGHTVIDEIAVKTSDAATVIAKAMNSARAASL